VSVAAALDVVRRRLASRDRRGQDGYVLMVALGVIALTFLTIIALLGLAFTTSKVTTVQREANERNRAADGALEAALTAVSDGTTQPCDSVPVGSQTTFDGADGPFVVDVECATGTGAELADDPDADFGGDSVFVADQDQGALQTGDGPPLRFDADVLVRGGATGPSAGGGPAYQVLGQYRQGLAGVGVADQASTDCGPLVAPGDPQRVADRNDTPQCGFVQANGTPLVDAPLPRDQGRSPLRTAVDISAATCATTTFAPGYYGPAAVEKLNALFETCSNATFVFAPAATPADSVYQFDANDPDAGVDRDALVIDNQDVTVIFGVASAVALAGSPLPLCDRTESGSSIELTGRTALRHRAGRLAVCPANGRAAVTQIPNAGLDPVINLVSSNFQPAADVTGSSAPAFATFPQTCLFTNPPGLCRTRNIVFTTTNLPAVPIEQVNLVFNSVETPKTQPQDRNVELRVTNVRAPGSDFTCAYSALGRTPGLGTALDLGACAPALVGQPASVLDGARFTVTVRYGRDTAVVPGPQIRLGIWDLHLQVNTERAGGTGATANGWNNPTGALDYDDADVAGFVASTGSGIPAEAAKYGSWAVQGSTRTFTVTDIELDDPNFRGRDAELSALDLVVASREPAVPSEGYPTASAVSDAGDGSTLSVQITREEVGVCTFDLPGYGRSSRPVRVDLLERADCADDLLRSGDLTGLDVTLTYTLGCARFTPAFDPLGSPQPLFDANGNCLTVRVPDVGFVGLEAATDVVFDEPPASELTTDSDGSGGALAQAQIFGDVLMGGSELQVRWAGGAPGAGVSLASPLVVGNLQAGRITSTTDADASVGTVCCYLPNPQQGRIQAVIDGTVWAETLVAVDSIDGTATAPRELLLLDWRFCGSGGCGPRRQQVAGP
jgi:hypothetical protein